MKRIVFVDVKCKVPYTFDTLAERGVGGTESTVLRVAQILAADYAVYLMQSGRTGRLTDEYGLTYLSFDEGRKLAAEGPLHVVITIRKIKAVREMLNRFPGARHYLWIHDLPVKKYCRYRSDLVNHDVTVICNSQWQYQQALKMFKPNCLYQRLFHPVSRRKPVDMTVIYNAINPSIQYEESAYDIDKLVFFSAPRKGLKQVLEHFSRVLDVRPQTKLYIANPGYEYMPPEWIDHPSIINLGSLSNADVIRHVREAFCVFYPQMVLPETFGIIYAEANSVGTPVLCYDFGAASEVLQNPEQLLTPDQDPVDKLIQWYRQGRPRVRARQRYQLNHVASQWQSLLNRQTKPD